MEIASPTVDATSAAAAAAANSGDRGKFRKIKLNEIKACFSLIYLTLLIPLKF